MWWTDDDTVIIQQGGGGAGEPVSMTGSGLFTASEPVTARWTDQVNVQDTLRVNLLASQWGRSGTPDTDQAGDCWVVQSPDDENANHGNEDLQVKSPVAGLGERRAFIEIDLTWAANFVGQSGTPFTFQFLVSHNDLALAQNMIWRATRFAARPFTESIATWTNANGLAGTAVANGSTADIPVGAATQHTITLTKAQLDPCLGQWLLIRLTDDTASSPTFTVRSRDGASNRWQYDLLLEQP